MCFSFSLLPSDNWGNSDVTGAMSLGEFIELRDLRSEGDQIELTRSPFSPPRLERANALRISPGKVPDLLSRVGIIRVLSSTQDPQFSEEKGEGHHFQPCSHAQPTWCDLCGDFIWGLYKQSLRCTSESTPLSAWLSVCLWSLTCMCTETNDIVNGGGGRVSRNVVVGAVSHSSQSDHWSIFYFKKIVALSQTLNDQMLPLLPPQCWGYLKRKTAKKAIHVSGNENIKSCLRLSWH